MDREFIIDRNYVEAVRVELTRKNSMSVPGIGLMTMPVLDDIDFLNYYLSIVMKYCEIYNDPEGFEELHINNDPEVIEEMKTLIKMFTGYDDVTYSEYYKSYLCGTELKIDKHVFNIFIGTIKIAHHLMEKEEYFLPANEKARKHILEVRKRKKALKKRQEEAAKNASGGKAKQSTGLSLSKLISALCSRHPSINHLNVGKLSYYQLFDAFQMLNNIDRFNTDVGAALAGAGNGKIAHYTE